MSDPTITLTNLGDKGVDAVFGVIYPPQVAIVGFGKPAQRVVVVDGGIRVATTVRTSLAADHRASDGARVRCSWPRSTGCCSSPKNCRGDDMSRAEIRDGVVAQLIAIAPEVEEGDLSDGELLRDQVDLDSMDWLNFLVALHKRFDVEIPESEYASLRTIDDLTSYIDTHR